MFLQRLKAEQFLHDALDSRRLKLGDTHPHTIESLNNLIDLYEAWKKPEKANEWRAQLAQIGDVEKRQNLLNVTSFRS